MKQKNVILMVVAVGCGLVAAFLTSQMSAKPIEQADVVVAAKDLPVGTILTRDDLKDGGAIKMAKRPKEGLSPTAIVNPEDLVGKGLSRPIRADEALDTKDLRTGGIITLPDGYDMVSLQIGANSSAAGFVGPGSRVNVLATLRLGAKLEAFPLLVNMLVLAVDTHTAYVKDTNGTFPSMNTVSFAVKEKEALLLSLAKSRGCALELLLRHPSKSTEADKRYNIDEVIKLLSDDKDKADVKGAVSTDENKNPGAIPDKKPDPMTQPDPLVKQPDPPIAPPMIPMVKVLVAKSDIAPNTEITKDLIADAFEEKSLPKEFAGSAMGDLSEAEGKFLKTGVSKGQWVTPGMVGLQSTKVKPPEEFVPKPPVVEPKSVEPPAPVVKKKTHDVIIHTSNGTTVVRYEEVAPGQWKKVAELTAEQAAQTEARPDAPSARPEKKSD